MELDILQKLDMNFTIPSILKFIDRFSKVLKLDQKS